MAKVYVKFPKAGLGNLLLIWARAKMFAEINGLDMVTSPWWGFRWGAWLRNEKKKRMYMGYFRESSFVERIKVKILIIFFEVVKNPLVKKLEDTQLKNKQVFVFDTISTGNDIFLEIRESREFIKKEIYKLLQPSLLNKLNGYEEPVIAVHIRRGDFKIGNQLTELSFFCNCISAIRAVAGDDLPVTVFTDASPHEIEPVLQLPKIAIASDKPDVLDILLMSRSRVMVLSRSSTFSYWAAYLSDAIVLRPADDWQQQIRSNNINLHVPEINWTINSEECLQRLEVAFKRMATS